VVLEKFLKCGGNKGMPSKAAVREFKNADLNRDGVVSRHEFSAWYAMREGKKTGAGGGKAEPLSSKQMWALFLTGAIPFIGFGFLDNAIMLTAGDAIEDNLGLALGLSTLAAAGLGNLISDVAGLGLSGEYQTIMKRYVVGGHAKLCFCYLQEYSIF
jgi:hypothetical protein